MAKRKKIPLTKDKEFYAYKTGNYVRQALNDDKGCKEYRVKSIKQGRKLLLCITDKEGKRGGHTKAVSLLRSINVNLREYKKSDEIRKAIKKFRELKQKNKAK